MTATVINLTRNQGIRMPYEKKIRDTDSDGISLLPEKKYTGARNTVIPINVPRKEDVAKMEYVSSKVESIKEQFAAVLAQINQLETDSEKTDVLVAMKTCLDSFQKSSKPSILNFPEKHKPDLSAVPLWGGKIKDGAAIEWLGKQYGMWLEHFGADRNFIFRQDILSHDRKLVKAIDQEAHKQQIKSREFLPTQSDAVDEIAQSITARLKRTANTLQRRQYKR
jgi:hypothetical protein